MKRLTADNPETATMLALNFFYAKDGEAMTRYHNGDGKPLRLFDFIREAAKGVETPGNRTVDEIKEMGNDELLNGIMYDNLLYSIDTPQGVLAYLYLAVWVAAELRERLKKYEDAEEAPGRWAVEKDEFYMGLTTIKCPKCREEWCFEDVEDVEQLNYKQCPNCGARLKFDAEAQQHGTE